MLPSDVNTRQVSIWDSTSFALSRWLKVQDDKLQLDVISFNAAISSCAKSMNWLWAMQLLDDLQQSELETDGISFNAALSAAAGWQTAFRLLEQMDLCQLQRDIVSFNVTWLIFYCSHQKGSFYRGTFWCI